jgi:hypothetical protein
MRVVEFRLTGTAPYMQSRFSQKAQIAMEETQKAGSQAKSKKKRAPRDFEKDYEAAKHISVDGWVGIPASAFRKAAISACRLVQFQMTKAKLSIFTEADGYDVVDGTPLVRIFGEPEMTKLPCRNDNGGMDIRARPLWRKWSCVLRIRFDNDQFSAEDVTNLVVRIGQQVGVGEGRPDSKESAGMGFGLFNVEAA